MRKIKDGIVFSNDIERILRGNNAINFDYEERGLVIPKDNTIEVLRDSFREDVNRIFNNKVSIVEENEMLAYLFGSILDVYRQYPIVSLDSVYLEPDDRDILFLDCTRLNGSKDLVSRIRPDDDGSVKRQIRAISERLIKDKNRRIVLADDVVFSGSVLKSVSDEFKKNGIDVVGVRSAISTREGYDFFSRLPLGIKCGCLLESDVIDQICERDFYFGVAQSGISIKREDRVYKAPYFEPYGDPVERASIPSDYSDTFSRNCIVRSLALWKRIEKLSGREILVRDLPEVIQNTNGDDSVILELSKRLERKREISR